MNHDADAKFEAELAAAYEDDPDAFTPHGFYTSERACARPECSFVTWSRDAYWAHVLTEHESAGAFGREARSDA